MSARDRKLQSILSWGALVLSGLALAAAIAVIGLAMLLHRASMALEASTHGVRVAVTTEVDLFVYAQATNPLIKRDLALGIQRRLLEANAYVGTDHERMLLDRARTRVDEYVLMDQDADLPPEEVAGRLTAAYATLEELVQVNVAQASETARQAARVDHLASIGGFTLALLVVGAATFFVYWVRGPLIRPVLELGQAMNRFRQGDHTARVRVAGPRELKEMGERFNEMAAQIEWQRKQQRAFLAGVAHDLRNPVNALRLSMEAARPDASLPPEHRAHRAYESGSRQVRKLDRMISDFLDAAAIEAGQLELRLDVRDLREIVRSAAELFKGTSPRHELVVSLPSEPVRAEVDPLRIEQVTCNLISNAIKYAPEGGNVEVRLERAGDELVLAVSDQGLGMSPKVQSRLFEPFRRGLSREGIPGVGLGLFIVRRIVEAHHGRIEVKSAAGVGSTFRAFLPASSAAPEGSRLEVEEAAGCLRAIRSP